LISIAAYALYYPNILPLFEKLPFLQFLQGLECFSKANDGAKCKVFGENRADMKITGN